MSSYKRSEITKESILSTAAVLFLEKGYTATTVRDICHASGVSVSRVNYHFSSKAELAQVICRDLFMNLYSQIKLALNNTRSYSFVTEAISLRFLVDIMVDEESYPAGHFYKDLAREGVLGAVFTAGDQTLFTELTDKESRMPDEKLENRMGIYSRIFSASLSALAESWEEALARFNGDREAAKKLLADVLAGLFMQLLDMPHEAQQAMVDISEAYYRMLRVELNGLTDVKVTMLSED